MFEVIVAMEQRNTGVLGGSRGDQGVGQRHAVIPVSAFSQLPDRAHRRVSDDEARCLRALQ